MKNSNKSFLKIAITTLLITLGSQTSLANASSNAYGVRANKAKINPFMKQLIKPNGGSKWQLVSAKNKNGKKLMADKITKKGRLKFNYNKHANSYEFIFDLHCNRFLAPLNVKNKNITPKLIVMLAAPKCPIKNSAEQSFSKLMHGTSTFFLKNNGKKLVQVKKNGIKLEWKVSK